jgi:hypothetical protein
MHLKPKEPERYNGTRDFQKISNWIASVDSYFAITGAEPPMIYHYLNTIFADEAATWFRYTYREVDPSTLTWDTVKTALLEYFVRPNHTRRLRDQWAEARQTGSVTEYHTYLAQLAMQLGNTSQEEFLDKFIRGLKPNTRTELEFRDPRTIVEAVKWADTYDARYYRKKDQPRYYSPFPTNPRYQDDNRGEPMQIDALQTTSQQVKLTKLTNEERTHLRSIGACFRCRKQGHMARECPAKANNNSGNSNRQ